MAKRKSLHIKGMEHGAPIPNGVVIGNMIFSSALSGKDAKTGVLSPDPDEQAEAMFLNLRLFMESAGGTPDNIAYMKVYLKEEKLRDSVNKAWLKMFPDEHDRPARHAAHPVDLEIGPMIKPDLARIADIIDKLFKYPPFIFGAAAEKFNELIA